MLPGVAIALTFATFGLGIAGGVFMLHANARKLEELQSDDEERVEK